MIDEQHKITLVKLLGEKNITFKSNELKHYGVDWTKVYKPKPSVVVFPVTIEQVQSLVKWAINANIALVPSGGRTGLSAGAVATQGEVVVSFEKMNKILEFSPLDQTVRCQAGVVTAELQRFALENELFYPVDFASSGSSQLGGNIATNAGGIKVIRYGLTRDWVAGLTVVTGTGEILQLNKGLIKNATGYDLRHLFIGSEGTLGFIVEATMRLTQLPKLLQVLVIGVTSLTAMMQVFQLFQQQVNLFAFEFFSESALQKVLQHMKLAPPFQTQTPYYVLLEFEQKDETDLEQVMTLFEFALNQGWIVDGVVSQSELQAKKLWQLRESISESIASFTPYKNDISVAVSKMPDFSLAVEAMIKQHYPNFEVLWFGHIGDGNLHLNILKPMDMSSAEFFKHCHKVSEQVFDIVAQFEGSISAEHGVGLIKKDFLHFTRSSKEIEYLRQLKRVFDPYNLLNPGKLVNALESSHDYS